MDTQQVAIKRVILVAGKGLRATIAALRYMMGCPGNIARASRAMIRRPSRARSAGN
jgi:hypothetical protein